LLDVKNPPLLYIGVGALVAVGAYAFWREIQTMRSINGVAVNPKGLFPPFKSR